jgi:GT2 family glycosyltransferase
MTSFLTTGGIRGGGENFDKFYPRSFNMGFSKKVFKKTKGFSNMRFGEDIDMSIRILQNNFRTRLFQDAYVYHKRRSNIRQFFKQIFNSGIARIQLYIKYPFSLKFVHLLPLFFLIGLISSLCLTFFISSYFLFPLLFHMSLLLIDSTVKSKNLIIGLLSVITSYTQLISYSLGFILAFWRSIVLKRGSFSVFRTNFYK